MNKVAIVFFGLLVVSMGSPAARAEGPVAQDTLRAYSRPDPVPDKQDDDYFPPPSAIAKCRAFMRVVTEKICTASYPMPWRSDDLEVSLPGTDENVR